MSLPVPDARGVPEWVNRSFGEALAWGAQRHGDRIAVRHDDASASFRELAARVHAFARGLLELGVQPGDKVALWMSDGINFLVARWAVPAIGAVLVPVNTRFRDTDARYVLQQSESTTLLLQARAPIASYLDTFHQLGGVLPGRS